MGSEMRAWRREAAGATAVHAARGKRDRLQTRNKARGEECTWNIQPMFVTLEVSKLSGWLNAYACCRGSNGGHTVR